MEPVIIERWINYSLRKYEYRENFFILLNVKLT